MSTRGEQSREDEILGKEQYAGFDEASLVMIKQIEEEEEKERKKNQKEKPKITLSPEQIEHFRDAYNIFDKDGDGGVSVHELAHVMRCLGQDPSDSEVRRMFSEVDQDGSGEIDFEEFLEIMQTQLENSANANQNKEFEREDWMHAFRIFDLDNDGYITPEELGKVLSNMGEDLRDFELLEMIEEVSEDRSGRLSLDDFIKVMVNGIQID